MNIADDDGAGHAEQVVAARERLRVTGKTVSAEIFFAELITLNHGAHSTVEHEDTMGGGIGEKRFLLRYDRSTPGVNC